MQRVRWLFVAVAALLGMLLAAASAQAACVPGSRGPIKPSADTYANVNYPGSNFGSAYGWDAANVAAGIKGIYFAKTMHGYVKYRLPSIPAGCQLRAAVLRVEDMRDFVWIAPITFPRVFPGPIEVSPAGGGWRESTLTWDNQPGAGNPTVRITGQLLQDRWTITPAVAALYARGNRNRGLELEGEQSPAWFTPNSREFLGRYGNRGIPYLFVSWK